MTPDQFKQWRSALGFSQEDAANALGLSRGSVLNYERGTRREDGRPVEIPQTVALACDAVMLDEAARRGESSLLTEALAGRVRALATSLGGAAAP